MPVPFPFNTLIPAANNDPAIDQGTMQLNNLSTADIIAVDHIGFVNNEGGAHHRVQIKNNPTPGTPPVGYGNGFETLYSEVASGAGQLFFVRGAAATGIQLTGPGTPDAVIKGHTFLPGGLLLQWNRVDSLAGTDTEFFSTPFLGGVFSIVTSPHGTSVISLPSSTNPGVYIIDTANTGLPSFVWKRSTVVPTNNYKGFYYFAIGN